MCCLLGCLALLPAAAGNCRSRRPQQPLSTSAAVAAGIGKDVESRFAFAPNDALLATASQDKTVKLWKLPSLVLSHTLRGHRGASGTSASGPVGPGAGACRSAWQTFVCVWVLALGRVAAGNCTR